MFLRFLNKKLPKKEAERLSILDAIDLDSLRIQMTGESSLSLVEEQGEVYGISGDGSAGAEEEDKELLSDIIQRVNEAFGINLGEEDKVTLGQIQKRLNSNQDIIKVLKADNTEDVKQEHFNQVFKDTVIEYLSLIHI